MAQDKNNYNRNKWLKIIALTGLLMFCSCFIAYASNINGTQTYKDYIFVLVHGVHNKAGMWDGNLEDPKYRNMFGNLKQVLNDDLGLTGRVFYYTFSSPDGSNINSAKEFADPANPNNWLKKAREDFINWFKTEGPGKNRVVKVPLPSEIPSKYIVITHSMGNMSVRSYIYSDYLSKHYKRPRGVSGHLEPVFDRGFYNDDIAKVVFIAPPLLGTESAMMSFYKYKLTYDELKKAYDAYQAGTDGLLKAINYIFNQYDDAGYAHFVYNLAKVYASYRIYNDELWESIQSAVMDKSGKVRLDPSMDSTSIWNEAAWELMPVLPVGAEFQINELGYHLKNAKLDDPTKEPAYSIIYGRGVPVANFTGTAIGMVDLTLVNGLKDALTIKGSAGRLFADQIGAYFDDFSLTLMPYSGFWEMPTKQGQFLSLLMANRYMVMTNDGDLFVPTWSAKGKEVAHLTNAKRYEHIFKSDNFENYLNGQFEQEIAAATVVYCASQMFGIPKQAAALVYWGVAISMISQLEHNRAEIKEGMYAHGSIVKQYDLIKTAILDTPAIFTIEDIQIRISVEAGTTLEATALSFSVGAPIPSGYESVKVRNVTENRTATGSVNLPIPATLKVLSATGEGERKYITSMTVTKSPQRIVGKLNYLMPKLMKSFEYSFNFAAWKPIENVNPETGEFILAGLPFAEGQNIIAIHAENAVGIKSHQLLKVILNTIPLLPSELSPLPGTYTKNTRPKISGKFAKASYSGDPLENISVTAAKIIIGSLETDVTDQIKTTISGGAYDKNLHFEYTPSEALPDGQCTLIIAVTSNVGVSRAIIDLIVDTQAPTIAIEPLQPYSPRAPATIRWSASDEASPNLHLISCELDDSNNNLITTIATADSLSKGDNFFQWTGNSGQGRVSDGSYQVRIKAFDLAGNMVTAVTPLIVDSTPPLITGLDLSPNPLTANTSELGLTARVNENATMLIKFNNISNNKTAIFMTRTQQNGIASYTWNYNDPATKGPEDGVYRVELIARDEAGNESLPRTLESFRIDRTPPVVFGQIAQPYVLANVGSNGYKTTLSFNVNEAADVEDNLRGVKKVTVKIYNCNTGKQVDKWELTTERSVLVDASDSEKYAKGGYRFQIIAEDDVGNLGIAYASCVKDGIAPEISFPAEDGVEISGTIAIRGTALDPDWTNDKPFKQYRVYYAKGQKLATTTPGADWQTNFIEVPLVNRDPQDPKNVAIRPLQNNSTLAYLQTNNLENGDYTILVVVDEDNGESLATTRVIKVNNDPMTASAVQLPFVKLRAIPEKVEFKNDDSIKLPIGFINSVKPANVYVEVVKVNSEQSTVDSGEGTVRCPQSTVCYYKYFPNIFGAPFIGKPAYKPGVELGYFIWSDDDGYHLRWSADGSNHKFTGSIVLVGNGAYSDIRQVGGGIKVQAPLISWDSSISGGEGGIDFKIGTGQLMIIAKIDEDPNNPSVYASNVYLGVSKYGQQYLPLVIDVAGQRLVNLATMGGNNMSGGQNLERATQTVSWDGRLDTGGYVDNGTYRVRVRAEGLDGVGVATDESIVNISTPYEFKISSVTPADKSFSTLGPPDRVSVSYLVSKDSIINAVVQKADGELVTKLISGQEVFGVTPNNPHLFSWKGNYPIPLSGTLVDPGEYTIVLTAAAVDGSETRQETIDGINVYSSQVKGGDLVKLAPLGQTAGDSPYYFEAKGIGRYFPPKDFSYTLAATGVQRITAYPNVPFAALMHRGFKGVDVRADVTAKIEMTAYGYVFPQGWKGSGKSDTRTYTKTFNIHLDRPNEVHEISDYFTVGDIHRSTVQTGLGEPWPHVDKINFTVIFRPVRDPSWILDIVTIEAGPGVNRDTVKITAPILTEKGIFQVDSTWSGWGGETFGAKPSFSLQFALEDAISYSRLTNRFVPWIGFVNKQKSANELQNFSGYLNDLSKLGFPGKSYFIGPTAKAKTAPHRGEYNPDLSPGQASKLASVTAKTDGLDIVEPKVSEIQSKTDSKMSGTASDYTSYLSDEYLEFIPITVPLLGGYEYNNSPVVGPLKLSVQSSYKFIAKTDLTYSGEGKDGRIAPFKFSWPWKEGEYKTFVEQQDAKRKKLAPPSGNPQLYSGPTVPTDTDGTWWALDLDELAQRRAATNNLNTYTGTGTARYNKGQKATLWDSGKNSLDKLLKLPTFVINPEYASKSNTTGIKVWLTSTGGSGIVKAEDNDKVGLAWSTADDLNLSATKGLIKSELLIFNDDAFRGRREIKILSAYSVNDDYSSGPAHQYTFLKRDPFKDLGKTPVDNSNIEITDWQVTVKSKTEANNPDLKNDGVSLKPEHLNDTVNIKLKLKAAETRYVEILGTAPGPYELMFYDGEAWQSIYEASEGKTGRLAWWNVSRLNGQYTVLLRSQGMVVTTDINIGTLIKNSGGSAYSAYKRAQLIFPPGAFGGTPDKLVTITPVTMSEIKVRNRPILITHGPIVEIKPSPWKFAVSPEDKRPTLRFVYTFDDLTELGIDTSKVSSSIGEVAAELMLPWNIHQVTAAGDLQIVSDNHQTVENNNGEKQYVFYAALDHFSTYTLLNGKISLSAPIVYADRYITNKNSVTIYGTAEPGSLVTVYVKNENVVPDPDKAEPHFGRITAEAGTGNYRFADINLLQEGKNYIFVTSHLTDDKSIRTYSDVTIIRDTVPPSVEASQNIYAFSPNGDGHYDSVDFKLKTNEKGRIYFSAQGTANSGQLFNTEISAEANQEYTFKWSDPYPDGKYQTTVYAIDEAGNISNNLINWTTIDTKPPTILGLNAKPNPFTPNDDGVKDTTNIWYKLSEPAYAKCTVYSGQWTEEGEPKIFREYEAPTDNFVYPTVHSQMATVHSSAGSWDWDGRGSRGELLGGTYSYQIKAIDNVGNQVTSEVKSVVVDHEPTLVPYLYAEPDPFAPINPSNNYTEIKYYLARDQIKTSVAIIGEGDKVIKSLVNDELQDKGEHSISWYGDFDSDYTGATAVANPRRVGDGTYEFRIIAADPAGGKAANLTNTVMVDNVPPYILLKPVTVDYPAKKAVLNYNIPENVTIRAEIYDDKDNLVTTLITGEANKAGSYELVYGFSNEANVVGPRRFKLIATDRAKNVSEKSSETFAVDAAPLLIAENKATPNPFTPNGDGVNDQTRISYRVSGGNPDYITSVSIKTPSGATVRRLVENEPQNSGNFSFYWDGKNDRGELVADDYYEYQIVTTDQKGWRVEKSGTVLSVTSRPVVTISTTPGSFSPNGDGNNDKITFNYSLEYPIAYLTGEALVELKVYNSSSEAIWDKVFNRTPGNYSYEWDGVTTNQALVANGQYYVQIKGEDAIHTTAFPMTASFEVGDVTTPVGGNPPILPGPDNPTGSVDLSVYPASFSTNANPDGNDRPRQTNFYYTLPNRSQVTIEVYKVDEAQTLIKTLLAGEWQEGGIQQSVVWNGEKDGGGWASPGKYAFVLSGKSGGTVWVQNNRLILREPEQIEYDEAKLEVKNNPDPAIISPAGNSADPIQKRAKLYFFVERRITPEGVKVSDRFGAAGVALQTTKIGQYSVKVFSDVGLTSLVRTITTESDAWASTIAWEIWNGKNDQGEFVADGTYYLVVDVKDYAGEPAEQNLFTRAVVVDNSTPEISAVSASPYYFAPGIDGATALTTTLTYEVNDSRTKTEVTVAAYRGDVLVKTLLVDTSWRNNGQYSLIWDGSGPSGYVGSKYGGSYSDGVYTLKVTAVDEAGNSAEAKSVEVYVDTSGPNTLTPSCNLISSPSWSISNSAEVSWTDPGDNGGSGTFRYECSVNGGSWANLGAQTSWEGVLDDGSGQTVALQAIDKLGNVGEASQLSFNVDTVNPYFASGPIISGVPVNTWTTLEAPVFTFAAADATSGVKNIHGFIDGVDQGALAYNTTSWNPTLSEGIHRLKLRIYDNANRFTESSISTFEVDKSQPNVPVVSVTSSVVGTWTNQNKPKLTWPDPGDGSGSGVSYYLGYIDDVDQGTVDSGWQPTLSDGTHNVFVRAVDGVGFTKDSAVINFKIDTVAPTVSQPASTSFNPYLDDNVRIDFTASDPSPSSGFGVANITARIKYGINVVKTLVVIDDESGNFHVVWDGTDSNTDYENEGNYTLELFGTDNAGNQSTPKTTTITIWDDQSISAGRQPCIYIDGQLFLCWINGTSNVDRVADASVSPADHGNFEHTTGGCLYYADKAFFTLDYAQALEVSVAANNEWSEEHAIKRVSDDGIEWPYYWTGGEDGSLPYHKFTPIISAGNYYAWVNLKDGGGTNGFTRVYYKDKQDNQYRRNCGPEYAKNIVKEGSFSQSGPTPTLAYEGGPTSIVRGGITYRVYSSGGDIYFQKGEGTAVKITNHNNYAETSFISPVICGDGNGFYVAWQSATVFGQGIRFQKIPVNFAPLKDGYVGASSVKPINNVVTILSAATIESPTLISPTKNRQNVDSLRPMFEWQHHKGSTLNYQLDLAKNDIFTIDHRSFTRSENTGSSDKNDKTLFNYSFAIHEFDPGLDRDTYYWQVTALSSGEAATSEVWSFKIAPELTLTGITNYPNPFNPNRERTKIRYRLGADADEVKIRIYTITGQLVTELIGETQGEQATIWDKYNDVEWDGHNGRGDLVVNGIYPYEVIARSGDKSVSGRGKIAVLK